MNKNRYIDITFRNGKHTIWNAEKDEWDDYSMRCTDRIFIICRNGDKIAFYNMDDISSILVK